jgi:hypothetical protein
MRTGPMSSRIADRAVHKHEATAPSKALPIRFIHPDSGFLRIINSANETHRVPPAKARLRTKRLPASVP